MEYNDSQQWTVRTNNSSQLQKVSTLAWLPLTSRVGGKFSVMRSNLNFQFLKLSRDIPTKIDVAKGLGITEVKNSPTYQVRQRGADVCPLRGIGKVLWKKVLVIIYKIQETKPKSVIKNNEEAKFRQKKIQKYEHVISDFQASRQR